MRPTLAQLRAAITAYLSGTVMSPGYTFPKKSFSERKANFSWTVTVTVDPATPTLQSVAVRLRLTQCECASPVYRTTNSVLDTDSEPFSSGHVVHHGNYITLNIVLHYYTVAEPCVSVFRHQFTHFLRTN